jgi:hypothetical protein
MQHGSILAARPCAYMALAECLVKFWSLDHDGDTNSIMGNVYDGRKIGHHRKSHYIY